MTPPESFAATHLFEVHLLSQANSTRHPTVRSRTNQKAGSNLPETESPEPAGSLLLLHSSFPSEYSALERADDSFGSVPVTLHKALGVLENSIPSFILRNWFANAPNAESSHALVRRFPDPPKCLCDSLNLVRRHAQHLFSHVKEHGEKPCASR